MKRKLAFAAAVCTLAVPAIALGQTFVGIYDGHLDGSPDSSVTLKFSGATEPDGSSNTRLNAFVVRDLAVDCDDGITAILDHAKLKGSVVVGGRKNFRVTDNNQKTVFKVSGHIGVNKAFGKFRLTGKIEGTDNITRNCDSGSLNWVARP